MKRTRWNGEHGSATPLLAIVLVGAVLALSVLLVQTEHRVRVAAAQWAADGSALAAAVEVVPGAEGGGPEARRVAAMVAAANGARLISIEVTDESDRPPGDTSRRGIDSSTPISPTVFVEVEIGGVRARAAAAQFVVARR